MGDPRRRRCGQNAHEMASLPEGSVDLGSVLGMHTNQTTHPFLGCFIEG